MSFRRFIVLSALTAVLAALVVVDRWRVAGSRTAATSEPLLPHFDRRAVRAVAVEMPQHHFRLELTAPAIRSDGAPGSDRRWTVRVLEPQPPATHPARPSAVEALLAALEMAEIDRRPPNDAVTGLAPPAASLTVDHEGAASIRVDVGARDVSKRGVFVRVHSVPTANSAPRTVVVAAHLADVALRGANEYRDTRLLPDPRPFVAMDALELSSSREASSCRANIDNGIWRDPHRGIRLGRDAMERLLRALASHEVASFVPTGMSGRSAPSPSPRLVPATVTTLRLLAGDRRYFLSLSAATGAEGCPPDQHSGTRALLDAQPEPFCVDPSTAAALLRAFAGACERDSRLIGARPEEIRRVDITVPGLAGPNRHLVLDRAPDETRTRWRLREPPVAWSVDDDAVTAWLHDLAAVQLVPCPAPSAASSRTPSAAALAIATAAGSTEVTRIYPKARPRGGLVTIARSDEKSTACVPAAALASLQPEPVRFRDRHPLRLAQHDLVRVRVAEARQPALTLVRGHDGSWRSAPREAQGDAQRMERPVNATALERLLADATNLEVERYLSANGPSRSDPPDRTIDLGEARDGTIATHRIEIRRAQPPDGTCVGRLATGDVAFVLAAESCQRLLADVTN